MAGARRHSQGASYRPVARRAALAVALAALGATGCFRTSIVDRHVSAQSTRREWSATFFWGLAGDPEFDARRHCGATAARVRIGGSPLATGLTIVTLGIYVPRVVVFTCAPPAAAARSTALLEATEGGR